MPKRPNTPPSTPRKARGGAPPRYDWSDWRRRYIRGDDTTTLEALSAITGAPSLDALKKRSRAEDWPGLRAELRHQTSTAQRAVDQDLLVEVKTRQARLGRALQTTAVKGLANLDTQKLEAVDVARFAKVGAELERKALGMDELTVRLDTLRSPDDLKQLSTEDLLRILGRVSDDGT